MKPKSEYATPNWTDGARIQWYGERGIVNAAVSFVASTDQYVEQTKCLLQTIAWADGGHPSWIQRVTDVRLIVEIGLADFGNPDLMVICRVEGNDQPFVVFVEAKARPYQFSVGHNKLFMDPGYNSTINGQISLKYRFAQALANASVSEREVRETQELFGHYQTKLRDYAKNPRHLLKGAVLEMIGDLGLIGLSEDHCSFVALTWDDGPKRVFEADRDILPLFLDVTGADVFDRIKPRFGWLGYQGLQDALGLDQHPEYANACHGMIPYPAPKASNYRNLTSLADLPDDDAQTIRLLLGEIRAACAGRRCDVVTREHSWSVVCDGKSIVKVIPTGTIFVGLRTPDGDKGVNDRFRVKHSIQGVLFHGFDLDANGQDLSVNRDIRDMVAAVSRLYGQARQG